MARKRGAGRLTDQDVADGLLERGGAMSYERQVPDGLVL